MSSGIKVAHPAELHRLASKTRSAMGAEEGRAGCHSDVRDDDGARALQERQLDPEERGDDLDPGQAPLP